MGVSRRDELAPLWRRPPGTARVLTALVVVAGLLVAAFGILTGDVIDEDHLLHVDGPVAGAVQDLRAAWLTTSMRIITSLGSGPVVIPLLLVVGLVARRLQRSWAPMAFLVIAAGGATLLSTSIKLMVARPRPDTGALVRALGYGFPSGHSTTAMAAWLSGAIVLSSLTPRVARRIGIWSVAVLVVVLVGVSRVYLGVHAPTDVLGGWTLGALWVAVVLVVGHRLVGRRSEPVGRLDPPA
jgi:undecaprenyl-diphosphatase